MGLVGFAFLAIFIMTTLHAFGRWQTATPLGTWMHGADLLWVVFAVVAGRLYQPTRVTYGLRPSRPATPGLSQGLRPPAAPSTDIAGPRRSVPAGPDPDQ